MTQAPEPQVDDTDDGAETAELPFVDALHIADDADATSNPYEESEFDGVQDPQGDPVYVAAAEKGTEIREDDDA